MSRAILPNAASGLKVAWRKSFLLHRTKPSSHCVMVAWPVLILSRGLYYHQTRQFLPRLENSDVRGNAGTATNVYSGPELHRDSSPSLLEYLSRKFAEAVAYRGKEGERGTVANRIGKEGGMKAR